MRPIPKRLLNQSATLKNVVSKDKWQNETTTDIELTKIRIDATNKLVQSPTNQELQLTAVIFYDIKNSRPLDVQFHYDQPIEYNGEKHRIITIEPIYDAKKLHHYELGVI